MADRAAVDAVADALDARRRPQREERKQGVPIVGRTVGQVELIRSIRARHRGRGRRPSPDVRRRALEGGPERIVEATDAAEARNAAPSCAIGNVVSSSSRLAKPSRPGLHHRDRRRPNVLDEQSMQVSRTDAEPRRQSLDAAARHTRPRRSAAARARRGRRCHARPACPGAASGRHRRHGRNPRLGRRGRRRVVAHVASLAGGARAIGRQ